MTGPSTPTISLTPMRFEADKATVTLLLRGTPDRPLKGTGKLERDPRLYCARGPFAQLSTVEAVKNLWARVMNA
jgi:hypothetical protein